MLAFLLEAAFRSFLVGVAVWFCIAVLRARGTHGETLAWNGVLAASCAMPLLMQLMPITIVVPTPFSAVGVHVSPLVGLMIVWLGINLLRARNHAEAMAWTGLLAASFAMQLATELVAIKEVVPPPLVSTAFIPMRWIGLSLAGGTQSASLLLSYGPGLLAALYSAVALALLLRLTAGLFLTWRLARRARPVHAGWMRGCAVRVSTEIAMPGTFGSTIFLPQEYLDWSPTKRSAVIAHERSHVRRGDFYVQLLAAIHRCIFWFSPLAWFLEAKLDLLAEMASDDAAVGAVGDRPEYAGLLFEFATRELPVTAIAMARPEKIVERIDRILTQAAVSPALTPRKRLLLFAGLIPLVAGAAGLSLAAHTDLPDASQARPATLPGMDLSAHDWARHAERNLAPRN